ncbi:hypothetical protein EMEDMD4_920005 [Sinorhizobium medicae]|uniref:Uncharacterized protein n=1 Tax=Sinorhizobium medicae TaxID=110321 RepID=A0A508XBV7_9HYPH|nr:hypothetical protein EMEDMD4_920005 [Sinorhizobium medicae]
MWSHLEDRRWERADRVYEAANVILTRPVKGSDLRLGIGGCKTCRSQKGACGAGPQAGGGIALPAQGQDQLHGPYGSASPGGLIGRSKDRLSDGHSHQPSAARSLRRTMDGLGRYAISSTRDFASKRLANRSSVSDLVDAEGTAADGNFAYID